MKKYVDEIISITNYDANCRGIQSKETATIIVQHYFQKENISFENWKITEIPMVDDSGKYSTAICICINNPILRVGISLNITRDGKLDSVNPDELAEIDLNSITEAIEHPTAKY